MNNLYKTLSLVTFGVAIILLFPTGVFAQNFKGGIHAGLVGSQVAGDRYSGYNKAGISIGGWVSLQLTTHSVFHMELSFLQKGSRENPDYKERFNTYLMRVSYIEMPLLYRLIYSEKLSFEAGPALNILMHSYEHFNYEVLTNNPFRSLHPSFILGLSYNINDKLRANLRTNNSLTSIRKERVTGDVWRFVDYGQYNDALIISLYYQL